MKDINGQTLKVGYLVTGFGTIKGKTFRIVALTEDCKAILQNTAQCKNSDRNVYRYCSQIRKLEVEELI